MRILVTGAKGFIGKNLIVELRNRGYNDIYEVDKETDELSLGKFIRDCDFVFHLAGVNRPKEESEFVEGNVEFTKHLLTQLEKREKPIPVLFTSSIQAEKDNPYGRTKRMAEDLIFDYGRKTGAKVFVYRLPNVFGKWCRPNYNSAIATFCYNIARDLPITVNDPNVVLKLVYIDDVVNEFINALNGCENRDGKFCEVATQYTVKLGDIVELLYSFKKGRENLSVPNVGDDFVKKLYSTYISYLPEEQFSYQLNMKADERGSFTEFLKTEDRGQISVNVIKPGITKGNHWHHTKVEKFLVVSGEAIIRFRKIDCSEVIEYRVSGNKLEVVDIPPGYTHNITNIGNSDVVFIIWANEPFDPQRPDTYYLESTM